MEAPDESQLLIDQKICQLEKSIILLKNERNQRARIGRLPPEILSKVFTEAAAVVRQDGLLVKPAQRFNFSFVSQRWRAVAISTPEVWGILPDGHLHWWRVMLERSRTTALTLETSISNVESSKAKFVKEVLLHHSVRLQELKITSSFFFEHNATQLFLDTFPKSAPRLRTLCLISDQRMGKLPESTFSHAPLCSLELKGHILAWTSFMLTGLKKLKMTGNSFATPSVDFLNALRRMPNLESLELENSTHLIDLNSNQPVLLSALQRLRISSDTYDGLNPLQYFAIPMSTMVDLRCTAALYSLQPDAEAKWSTLNLTISHLFAHMSSDSAGILPTFHTLSISFSSAYTFKAWRKPWADSSSIMDRSDEANFALQLNAAGPSMAKAIPTVLTHISTLVLSATLDAHSLMQTFGDSPTLETIVFDGRSGIVENLFIALNHLKDSTAAGYGQVVFPCLENLVMYYTIFSEQDEVDYITLNDLLDCLIQRFECGAPIQKLFIIEGFDIYDDDIRLLEEVVVDVEWDHVTVEYEEDDEENEYDEDNFGIEDDSDEDDFYYRDTRYRSFGFY